MQRFKLTIEYGGAPFAGWQRQENALSVQQVVEEAICAFTQLSEVQVFCAGRTDAGVHAQGQVIHVDLPAHFSPITVRRAMNAHLKDHPVSVVKSEKVDMEFHARFSAKKRAYVYRIINRPDKLALEQGWAWHVPRKLDINAMEEGAAHLLGKHDFSAFRTVHCQSKNPEKTLEKIEFKKTGDLIEIQVEAPSFLHHQVRNIVGTLVQIGVGRWAPAYVKEILDSKDRAKAGPTAPAEGLYFVGVDY
jgi:tRNA pseudouridine38-40 synthase